MPFFPTKHNPLVLALIVIIGFLAGYFYYGQISSYKVDSVGAAPAAQDVAFLKLKDMKLNLNLFDTPVFASLEARAGAGFPSIPGGRVDIFNP